MMMPTGPSPWTNGMRFSSSSENMRSGTEKASVLPEPVKAMPIMSRPEKLHAAYRYASASGRGAEGGREGTHTTGRP